jgi:hypothetical protein
MRNYSAKPQARDFFIFRKTQFTHRTLLPIHFGHLQKVKPAEFDASMTDPA